MTDPSDPDGPSDRGNPSGPSNPDGFGDAGDFGDFGDFAALGGLGGPSRLRELGESIFEDAFERLGRSVARVQERTPLPHDLLESDDAYLVVFDAPGVRGKDVQVRFVDGEVRVRIDRFRDFREGFEMRFPGRGLALDGSARLPAGADVDPEGATATVTEEGTLEVRVPKRDRRVDIGGA